MNPDPCPECGQPQASHVYPEIVPCPKCGSIEWVSVWEAWGHPNGELYCQECVGHNSNDQTVDYWTWHMENGQPAIDHWENQEPEVTPGGLIVQGWINHG